MSSAIKGLYNYSESTDQQGWILSVLVSNENIKQISENESDEQNMLESLIEFTNKTLAKYSN